MKKRIKTFIPKQDQRLPDSWGIKVAYQDGSKNEEFDGTHVVIEIYGERYLEITTVEDTTHLIPMEVIKKIELDKRWNLARDIQRELALKQQQKADPQGG